MYELKVSEYKTNGLNQTCSYIIKDPNDNILHNFTTRYNSNFEDYLQAYFSKEITFVKSSGSIFNEAVIKFSL